MENLISIKTILKNFELALGLKVNFSNICLFGVNVGRPLLDLAEEFLHSRVGSLPFKYLGVSVGENTKKEGTWDPFVNLVSKRLSFLIVSLGGRVVMLNSILI